MPPFLGKKKKASNRGLRKSDQTCRPAQTLPEDEREVARSAFQAKIRRLDHQFGATLGVTLQGHQEKFSRICIFVVTFTATLGVLFLLMAWNSPPALEDLPVIAAAKEAANAAKEAADKDAQDALKKIRDAASKAARDAAARDAADRQASRDARSSVLSESMATLSAANASGCSIERGYANNKFAQVSHESFGKTWQQCQQQCHDDPSCNCFSWKDDSFCRIGWASSCTYAISEDDDRWRFGKCVRQSYNTKPAAQTKEATGSRSIASTTSIKVVPQSAPTELPVSLKIHDDTPPQAPAVTAVPGRNLEVPIPVLVICHARPQYLQRALSSVFKHRSSRETFPLTLSQDGDNAEVTAVIKEHLDSGQVVRHLRFTTGMPTGYHRLCQHYKWAFAQMFDVLGFKQLIVLEEDLEVSPDFFNYFKATLPILKADPKLFCVSAWNDNGKSEIASDAYSIYRSDFFPGLGWMLLAPFWKEIRDRWPPAYWDEFVRHPDVRRGRHCLRPEVSRTHTFGKQGVSVGQFYETHLASNALNDKAIDWPTQDLSHVSTAENFDKYLTDQILSAERVPLDALKDVAPASSVPGSSDRKFVVRYDDRDWGRYARFFGLMEDEKAGIRRGTYRGVFPFTYRGYRTFLVRDWPF
eukprot:TRINITY_DN31882_c0_g1_i2.p1 TRINITY_DN31882_c0_g1~~TRINITY_DN31882_c0_g1_i2.p1  ORF type:complete len:641 (+),score=99.06 TRINITY_DN31882_c0_g1_i2:80-2002(+)